MSLANHFNKTEEFGFSDATLDNQPLRQFRLAIMMISVLAVAVASLGWSAHIAITHGSNSGVKTITRAQ